MDIDAFLGGKTRLARALAAGECGGRYEDAILIVSSVFNAFAAHFWPRPGDYPWDETEQLGTHERQLEKKKWIVPDAKRFVEFWVTYGDPNLGSSRISVPLLAHSLLSAGDLQSLGELKKLRSALLRYAPAELDGQLATGEDDADEIEIASACPSLALRQIRRFSYPAVFYREVRSPYVHELWPGKHASRVRRGNAGTPIAYSNVAGPPHRRIDFHIDWLCAVAESCAYRAYPDWNQSSRRCCVQWWVDGA